MKKQDAMQPFEAIKKQLAEIANSLGLTLDTFALVLEDDPDLHCIQTQFTIRSEAVMSDAEREQAEFDRAFEQIEIEEREKELQDKKIPKIKAEIDDWLSDDS